MHTFQNSADRIQNQIKEAEKANDLALLSNTQLLQSLIQARLNHDVHPMTGHAAMLRLANASKAQLAARGDLGRVHAELTDIAHDVRAEIDEKDRPTGILAQEEKVPALAV